MIKFTDDRFNKLTEAIEVQGAEFKGNANGFDVFQINTWRACQQFQTGTSFINSEDTFNSHIRPDNYQLYFFVRENTNQIKAAAITRNNNPLSSNITVGDSTLTITAQLEPDSASTISEQNLIPLYLIPNFEYQGNDENIPDNLFACVSRNRRVIDACVRDLGVSQEALKALWNRHEALTGELEQFKIKFQNNGDEINNFFKQEFDEGSEIATYDEAKEYWLDYEDEDEVLSVNRRLIQLFNEHPNLEREPEEARQRAEQERAERERAEREAQERAAAEAAAEEERRREEERRIAADRSAAQAFDDAVRNLTDDASRADVQAVRAIFNDLTPEQRHLTDRDLLTHLNDHIRRLNDIENANALKYKIVGNHVVITGISRRIESLPNNTLEIPAEIEGKPVTEIGSYAFYNAPTFLRTIRCHAKLKQISTGSFSGLRTSIDLYLPNECENKVIFSKNWHLDNYYGVYISYSNNL